MDPFKLLKEDHKRVRGLFREFEGASDEACKTKERIAQTVSRSQERLRPEQRLS